MYEPSEQKLIQESSIIHRNFKGNWFIEVQALAHNVTRIGLGMFYKCDQNDMTMAIFESAKEKGIHDNGQDFVLVLRRDDDPGDIHDKAQITKNHFEKITGLKALSVDEYFQKCESVPQYKDVGAILIDFLSLKKS